MALLFDPFRELDRVAGQLLDSRQGPRLMPMDLYREGDEFVARIDLPGVDPASIDVDVDERTLTVRAQRAAQTSEGQKWLVRERPNGTFARQLTLGYGVALDKIAAEYVDGVLSLKIPVAEEAKPRKITVQSSAAAAAPQGEVTAG